MNKHSFWQNSQCRNSYLHRFSIKNEYPEGVMEVCEICGMSKFFRIIDGKVNNFGYMSWHQRQGLNPIHPFFNREYRQYGKV